MKGTVIKSTGNWYSVRTDAGEHLSCRIKGRLRIDGYKSTNPIAVGDRVEVEPEGEGQGIISGVEERRNCIIRKSKKLSKQSHILATNVDQALIVVTLAAPHTSFGFIDRFLATAEAYRIPAILVFNKADLLETDPQAKQMLNETAALYEKIGYRCYAVSSTQMPESLQAELSELLKDKTTLLAGHSGVRKSTFINALEPGLDLKTQEISDAHQKGIHTTTFTEMHPLQNGGYVIDTPGISEFSLINMDKNEIFHFFPEIFKQASACKYNTCLHMNEPKCAVIKAVEEGTIAATRYHSYLSIMNGEEVIKEYDD